MFLDPRQPFVNARLKHIWANEHIGQLQSLWERYLNTDFAEIRVQDDPQGRGQNICIAGIRPPPADIALCLGDAIHNLKSALDYIVSELLGWQNTRLTFPMSETREELVTSFSTDGLTPCPECGRGGRGKGRNAAIEMAVPGIGLFIVDTIKPYKAANGFLWPLNKLDVRDKHRLLIPTVVPKTIRGINAVDNNGNRIVNCSATVREIGTAAVFGLPYDIKIESYGKPTAEILFNEVGVIENQPLFPTLINMSQTVSETIDLFADFAKK